MTTEKMFERATRKKVRFPYKGKISTEDLWDLDVNTLDKIFQTLNSEAKKSNEESLLNSPTEENKELSMQIEIVKHIVLTKLAEAEARKQEKEKATKKQKILEALAEKQDSELKNKTPEELKAMLDTLN